MKGYARCFYFRYLTRWKKKKDRARGSPLAPRKNQVVKKAKVSPNGGATNSQDQSSETELKGGKRFKLLTLRLSRTSNKNSEEKTESQESPQVKKQGTKNKETSDESSPLPGETKKKRRSSLTDKLLGGSADAPFSTITIEMLQKLTDRGKYPIYLDFSSDSFNLTQDEFLNRCPPRIVKECNLSNNQLVEFNCTTPFQRLKRLWITNNQLSNLSLCNLSSLLLLSLSHNRLEILPDLTDLNHLVHLDLSHNLLIGGFSELSKLKSLVYFDISFNSLDMSISEFYYRILQSLHKLSKLKNLNISSGNLFDSRIFNFRHFLISELPSLSTLDQQHISREERSLSRQAAKRGIWDDKFQLKNQPQGLSPRRRDHVMQYANTMIGTRNNRRFRLSDDSELQRAHNRHSLQVSSSSRPQDVTAQRHTSLVAPLENAVRSPLLRSRSEMHNSPTFTLENQELESLQSMFDQYERKWKEDESDSLGDANESSCEGHEGDSELTPTPVQRSPSPEPTKELQEDTDSELRKTVSFANITTVSVSSPRNPLFTTYSPWRDPSAGLSHSTPGHRRRSLTADFDHLLTELQTLSKTTRRRSGSISRVKSLLHPVPRELLLRIFSYLDHRSLAVAMCTCTGWYEIGKSDMEVRKLLKMGAYKQVSVLRKRSSSPSLVETPRKNSTSSTLPKQKTNTVSEKKKMSKVVLAGMGLVLVVLFLVVCPLL